MPCIGGFIGFYELLCRVGYVRFSYQARFGRLRFTAVYIVGNGIWGGLRWSLCCHFDVLTKDCRIYCGDEFSIPFRFIRLVDYFIRKIKIQLYEFPRISIRKGVWTLMNSLSISISTGILDILILQKILRCQKKISVRKYSEKCNPFIQFI